MNSAYSLGALSFPFPRLGLFCKEDVVKDMEKMDVMFSGRFACQEAVEGKFCALSVPWI